MGKLKYEEIKRKEESCHKAAAVPKSTYVAHKLKESDRIRQHTVPKEPVLHSSLRSIERAEFQQKKEEAENCSKHLLEQQKIQKDQEELEEIARLRNTPIEEGGMLFRAKGIATSAKPVYSQSCTKPLTNPEPFAFQTDKRASIRSLQKISNSS